MCTIRYGRFLGAATSIYWNKQLKLIKKEQDLNIILSYRWYLNVIILMYIARKEVSALTASMEGHKKVCMSLYIIVYCIYVDLYMPLCILMSSLVLYTDRYLYVYMYTYLYVYIGLNIHSCFFNIYL